MNGKMTQPSKTLLGLVEHYSPTGEEGKAVAWLVERMRTLGFTSACADEAGNAVGTIGEGPGQIVLMGHIDTVPGRIDIRVEDGILHGRGSVDAKGPLAAFVDASARIGAVPGWQIIVIGAVDEEDDSAGARHAVPKYHPRYAVIGEPSGWNRIALGYRGITRFRFTAHKTVGHTAAGQESACEAAVGFWNTLAAIGERSNRGIERNFDRITPVLEGMSSGGDGFTDTAELIGHLRLPRSIPPDAAGQLLREAAGEAGSADVFGHSLPAYRAEKNTPVVAAFLSAIRSQEGVPAFSIKLGTCDLNVAGPQWQCPMAVYGPGDSALDHTPEERTSLAEYERSVDVLEAVLKRLTAAPG
jgi:LysW-gamma-L-lysine carboxypeptidase